MCRREQAIDEPVGLDDPALRDRLHGLVQESYRGYVDILAAVDVFDRRGLSQADGFRTTKTWLEGCLGMSGPAADRLVKAARLLRELPKLAAAAQTGQVSPEHIEQVLRLARRVDINRLVAIDATLADAAMVLDLPQFVLVCQRAEAHLNPDGGDPGEDFDKRGLTISPLGRMSALRGQLDPEGTAAVTAALDALMKPPAEGDDRTGAQRRADALVDLARLHLAAGDLPAVGGQRPQVGVLLYPQALSPELLGKLAAAQRDGFAAARLREWADAAPAPAAAAADPAEVFGRTAEAMRGDLAGTDHPQTESNAGAPAQTETGAAEAEPGPTRPGWLGPAASPEASDEVQRATAAAGAVLHPVWSRSGWADPPYLNWVGPIPNEVAQRIACDADLFRLILDPASGMPLDVGRSHRLVPYWMRKALYARDRTCRWRGCNAPAEWTDGHHLDGWVADGGETKVERCILLCRYHHVLVHEGGWSIDLDVHTGEVIITRPGGLPYQLPRGPTSSWNGPTTRTR